MGRGKLREDEAFLDLTPLIDIILQLVIFFVLTTAFIPFAIKVELPQAQSSPAREEKLTVITVTKDERFFWEKEETTLVELLRKIEKSDKNTSYLIRGDKGVRYGVIIELLNELKKRGVERVGLIVEPEH